MRLIKNQNTNNRSIIGNGVKFNPATGITTIPGDSLLSPTGDTSQRPTGVDGYLRFNTDYGKLEYYYDDSWRFVGSGGSDGVIVTQTLYSGFNQFDKLFGQKPRDPQNEKITQFHMDIAASIQKVTEEIMIKLAKSIKKQ